MTVSKTEQTIKAYNKNAEKYDLKFKDFSTYKKKIIEFQDQFVSEGARILDLGCGPGNNITTIKSLDGSCQFTGIDLSEELLGIAKKIHPTCTFINQNICDLKLLDLGQYDNVIASFCIVHLDNDQTDNLLKSIAESLVEGGSLYLSFMAGKTSGFESTSFSDEEIYFNYYQIDSVLEMLEENALQAKVVSVEDYLEQDGSITSDIFVFARKI
ncbi:MAG: class I SAM-dependent methyltransferase [Desulforhopalus sp.]